MGFEIFVKGSAPVRSVPTVTIQKKGLISLNRAAQDMLGDPEAVELLWDHERSLIGIRAAELSSPNAYPTRHLGSKTGHGPKLIAGSLFTRHIGLDTSTARRWVPTMEEDILVVDITTPGQEASSNRARKARANSETSSIPAASSPEGVEEGSRQPVQV